MTIRNRTPLFCGSSIRYDILRLTSRQHLTSALDTSVHKPSPMLFSWSPDYLSDISDVRVRSDPVRWQQTQEQYRVTHQSNVTTLKVDVDQL